MERQRGREIEGVKVGGQQHSGHHKSDFPQSPAEGPSARPFADTLSGARSIDWRRHTDADCAGFGGRERWRGEAVEEGCARSMSVCVGGSWVWRNLPQHQTKTANQTQENIGVCLRAECADSNVISFPISTLSLTSTLALFSFFFFFFPAHHNLLPTHPGQSRLLRGQDPKHTTRGQEGNTNWHHPTCQLYLLGCLNKLHVYQTVVLLEQKSAPIYCPSPLILAESGWEEGVFFLPSLDLRLGTVHDRARRRDKKQTTM